MFKLGDLVELKTVMRGIDSSNFGLIVEISEDVRGFMFYTTTSKYHLRIHHILLVQTND